MGAESIQSAKARRSPPAMAQVLAKGGNAAASLLSLITYIPVGNAALADWV
jgi:hypothetical protein